jgi:hypothetical protein
MLQRMVERRSAGIGQPCSDSGCVSGGNRIVTIGPELACILSLLAGLNEANGVNGPEAVPSVLTLDLEPVQPTFASARSNLQIESATIRISPRLPLAGHL